MTTKEAAERYEAEHVASWRGHTYAVVNPNGRPEDELPVIYGFNNGGQPGCLSAQLIAEDGTGLGSHMCSSEAYMRADLGILEGSRPDRHQVFLGHYPGGYRMEFVSLDDVRGHDKLNAAYKLNQLAAEADKEA